MQGLGFSSEMRLLVQSVVWRVEGGGLLRTPEDFDETLLMRLANHHQVLPWLWCYVDEFSIGSSDFRKKLARAIQMGVLRGQLQRRELVGISKRFEERGIAHLVFKGVSTEGMFYRGLVDSRYSDDIDILVSPDELASANDALLASGYQLRTPLDIDKTASLLHTNPSLYRWRDVGYEKRGLSAVKIDLHWRIADDFTLPVDTDKLLEQRTSTQVENNDVFCLPFTSLFVYTCVHAHSDYFFRLRYLTDVYCAMQQAEFDLQEVEELSDAWGVGRSVRDSIALAKLVFQQDSQASSQARAYCEKVVERFSDSQGFTQRSHPNKGEWSLKDKRLHLARQIRFRSTKAAWFAPILARLKYNGDMVQRWPEKVPPLIWLPMAHLLRIVRSDGS